MQDARDYTGAIYQQFALIGKALCCAPRLQILDVLEQAERSVEVLAAEVGLPVANTSHHLRALKRSRLVDSERRGQRVVYRLADEAVGDLLRAMRVLGERRLSEIARVTGVFLGGREGMEAVDGRALAGCLARGDCVVLDVRPVEEYDAGHLSGAVSIPLDQLERRLAELPIDRSVVAYCRGRYCVLAVDAVELLRRHGFDAVRASGSVPEWREQGLPVTVAAGAALS